MPAKGAAMNELHEIDIRSYVASLDAEIHQSTQGKLLANPCPLCGHMECFTIDPGTNTFKCFACDKQGGPADLKQYIDLAACDPATRRSGPRPRKALMKKLIGITGTHGTGKTTAALYRARIIKSEFPKKRIGFLSECASECPFPINKDGSADTQLWLFTQQIRRELEMTRHYDLIICDRTPADVIAYTWCLGFEPLALAMAKIAAPHMLKHYQQIIFRTMDKNQYCYADGRRDLDLEFRAAVESELQSTYRRMMILERIQYV